MSHKFPVVLCLITFVSAPVHAMMSTGDGMEELYSLPTAKTARFSHLTPILGWQGALEIYTSDTTEFVKVRYNAAAVTEVISNFSRFDHIEPDSFAEHLAYDALRKKIAARFNFENTYTKYFRQESNSLIKKLRSLRRNLSAIFIEDNTDEGSILGLYKAADVYSVALRSMCTQFGGKVPKTPFDIVFKQPEPKVTA